jgi:hypothetical protein
MGALLATYLTSKPAGAPLVYLIVAAVIFAVAGSLAVFARDLWRALLCAGLLAVTLAFLAH